MSRREREGQSEKVGKKMRWVKKSDYKVRCKERVSETNRLKDSKEWRR